MLVHPVTIIRSRNNSLVGQFRSAAKARRQNRGVLLLDGVRLIRDAEAADVPIVSAFVSHSALVQEVQTVVELAKRLEEIGASVVFGTDLVMEAVSPTHSPSDVVALGHGGPVPLNSVLQSAVNRNACVVAAVHIQEPGNLGAIVRTADAAGAGGVVVTEQSADPFGWKSLRGAMGSTFRLPISDGTNAIKTVEDAKTVGFKVLAAIPRKGTNLYDTALDGRILILIGGEGNGLQARISDLADITVSIPMAPYVDSLNVAAATAVILYEVRRQNMQR